MTITEHSDFKDLLGAYALDALDEPEAALIASHLKSCAQCREELAPLHETIASVSHADAQYDPAPLRGASRPRSGPRRCPGQDRTDRLARALECAAPLDRSGVDCGGRRIRGDGIFSLSLKLALGDSIVCSQVAEPNHRQPAGDAGPSRRNARLNERERQVPNLLGRGARRTRSCVTSSNLPTATTTTTATAAAAAAAASKTYQLWGLKKSSMVSIAIIGTNVAGAQFAIPDNSTFSELASTLEPSGGSVAPPRPRLSSARFTNRTQAMLESSGTARAGN